MKTAITVLFILTFILPGGTSLAGTTGKLIGTITAKTSGDPIPNAKIVLAGKSFGGSTDTDGKFEILNLPPGLYDADISALGYHEMTITEIYIATDRTTELAIEMYLLSEPKPVTEIGFSRKSTKLTIPLADPESAPDDMMDVHEQKSEGKIHLRGSRAGGDADRIRIQAQTIMAAPSRRAPVAGMSKSRAGRRMPPPVPPHISPTPRRYPPNWLVRTGEEYDQFTENAFEDVFMQPLSTFSIDVDAASYTNTRRYINDGYIPPRNAVRIEEFVNYFNYNYPQPEGDHPFSITTEISDCPWNRDNRLVHIGLQGKVSPERKRPPSNLVFLIDVSGSMRDFDKLPLLKSSFNLMVEKLRKKDRLAIVVYSSSAAKVLESTPGNAKDEILEAITRLNAGGSTAGAEGIQLAYQVAKDNFIRNGNNRVILATDGDFNVGISDTDELVKFIEEKRDDGIFLTVLGFGTGNIKDDKMEGLADHGNGNYAYIDNILEGKKVLVSELGGMFTIAKDVKIQVEFNPAKVVSYRLIGYENRALEARDFNDDTKDAGELGEGHSVTALYELQMVGMEETGRRPAVDPLKYQKAVIATSGEFSDEIMTVKLRYKKPDRDKSRLIVHPVIDKQVALRKSSENFRFAAAVAEFGLLLRESEYAADASYDNVIELVKSSRGSDKDGLRAEFLRIVETSMLLQK